MKGENILDSIKDKKTLKAFLLVGATKLKTNFKSVCIKLL